MDTREVEKDEDSHTDSDSSDHEGKRKQAPDEESSRDRKASKAGPEKDISRASVEEITKGKGKDDNEKRIERRRAANRQSATKTRERQKNLVEDLRQTVAGIYKETTEIRNDNTELQAKLDKVLRENQFLKDQLLTTPQRNQPAPVAQLSSQNTITQGMGSSISTIGSLGSLGAVAPQNPGASNNPLPLAVPSSASNPIILDASQLQVRQVGLGGLGQSILSRQDEATRHQVAATGHQNLPTLVGQQQLQTQLITLPANITASHGRIDPNTIRVVQLPQQPLVVTSASQSSTDGQNAVLQNPAGQQAQFASLSSGSVVNSGGTTNPTTDVQLQQLLDALQQSRASQGSTNNNEPNRSA